MKIYVITKGKYSHYGIIAATLDYERAKKIAEKFNDDWNETRIEEYEDSELMLKPCWRVNFNEDGAVLRTHNVSDNTYAYYALNNVYKTIAGEIYCYAAADTEEAAIKIAAEKRAEYLAKKEGVC